MEKAEARIQNRHGLHLKVAAQVAKQAQLFESRITLYHRCRNADACSILQVLSLGAPFQAELSVTADGPDEQEAVRSIIELFHDGAGI